MNIGGICKSILNGTTAYSICSGRVYPSRAPQKSAYPAIVSSLIDTQGNQTKTSASDYDVCRVQFDFYAQTLEIADQVAESARDRLEFFFGVVSVGGVSYDISSTVFLDAHQVWEDEKEIHRITHDYQIRISRTLPIIEPPADVPGEVITSSTAQIAVAAKKLVWAITMVSTGSGTLKIGTSAGGNDIIEETDFTANEPLTISPDKFFNAAGVLHFSGLAGTTTIYVYSS